MAGLPDGVWGGCCDDYPSQDLPEAEYYGSAQAAFLSDSCQREEGASPCSERYILCSAAGVLGTYNNALPYPGLVGICVSAGYFDGIVYDEIQDDEVSIRINKYKFMIKHFTYM